MNKRANNFSTQEVDKLLDLVDKYKIIIGNKKTDRASTEVKNEGWKKVEKEFNATFKQNMRSDKVLRTKYENIKRKAKQNLASVRLGLADAKMSKADKKILSICSTAQMLYNTDKILVKDNLAPLCDFKIENVADLKKKASHSDTSDDSEDERDSAANTGNEAENDRESCEKLEAPFDESSAAENTGDESENDSWSNWQPNTLKKSLRGNPLRICRKRSYDTVVNSSKKKLPRHVWAMVAKKEINKIEQEMKQQNERHQLELKRVEQELAQQKELHQLAVKKVEQDLVLQRERHQMEMKKMEQFMT